MKIVATTIIILGLLFAGSSALADDDDRKEGSGPLKAIEKALDRLEKFEFNRFNVSDFEKGVPSSLSINPKGHVRITNGQVMSVASTSLTAKVWGFNFVVNVGTDTKIAVGKGEPAALADIRVDDRVNVIGQTAENAPGVINARAIHDQSAVVRARDEEIARIRAKIEELLKRLEELLRRTPAATTSTSSAQ